MSNARRGSLTVFILLSLLVGFIAKTFYDAGEFKTIAPSTQMAIETVTGVLSSEDITIHPLTGLAFISSADRRAISEGTPQQQGAVFTYDLQAENPRLQNITADFSGPFQPHGLSLFVKPDSSVSLFVVNHTGKDDRIEIFDQVGERFKHRTSLKSTLMFSPNDVVAIDQNRFYVTNDHGNRSAFGKTIEEYLQLSRSFVLYFDGTTFRRVADGLAYANGITANADGSLVFIAATVAGSVYVYRRKAATGDLVLLEEIKLGTGVDNLERDADGAIWIGAHPKLLTFVNYSKDASVLSPSHVLRLRYSGIGEFSAEDNFFDDGLQLSGSSVAAHYNNRYLVGSVFDRKFIICTSKSE